jgi:hypothetical protein
MIGSKSPAQRNSARGKACPRGGRWARFGASLRHLDHLASRKSVRIRTKLAILLLEAYHRGIIDRGSSLQASMAERE